MNEQMNKSISKKSTKDELMSEPAKKRKKERKKKRKKEKECKAYSLPGTLLSIFVSHFVFLEFHDYGWMMWSTFVFIISIKIHGTRT